MTTSADRMPSPPSPAVDPRDARIIELKARNKALKSELDTYHSKALQLLLRVAGYLLLLWVYAKLYHMSYTAYPDYFGLFWLFFLPLSLGGLIAVVCIPHDQWGFA